MASKTPVSILHEMAAKLNIAPPQYDLIMDHADGVNSEFKYQVTFNNIIAVGSGRSKKEAKHSAAEMAITKLSHQKHKDLRGDSTVTNILSVQEPIVSPFTNQVTRNYVGELADFCALHEMPLPLYSEVAAEGPSHAPMFTVSCKVSLFVEIAKCGTKKQAKHCVAKIMLSRLENCMKEVTKLVPDQELDPQNPPIIADGPITYKISELHLALERKYPNPPAILLKLNTTRESAEWNPMSAVKEVAVEMNVPYLTEVKKTKLSLAAEMRWTELQETTPLNTTSLNDDIDCDKEENSSSENSYKEAQTYEDCMNADDNKQLEPGTIYTAHIVLGTKPVTTVAFGYGSSKIGAFHYAAEEILDNLCDMLLDADICPKKHTINFRF